MAQGYPQRRVQSEADALKLVDALKSHRAKELERLQAYFEGTQYDGRPLYLDSKSDAPRFERKPCVIYPLAQAAIESNVALALGGTRFPRILSLSSEDDSAFDASQGLDQKSSEILDQFNAKLVDVCGFASSFRQAYRMAQAARSVALIGCYRNGLPALDPVWAKLCEPTFDPADPCTVIRLEIRYRYIEWQRDSSLKPDGSEIPVCKEYRRVIDDQTDTVYQPKEVWDLSDIEPSKAPFGTPIQHGFGFCPVRWWARRRQSFAIGGYDGLALHDGKLSELDAINHALSSRHLAALYTGDPIKCATGVDPDEGFGTIGRTARPENIDPSVKTGWDKAMYGAGDVRAIRQSPGELWRTPAEAAKFYYLALPKGALDALDSHASDLCSRVREALRYVWLDPEKLTGSGDVSGKTLAFVFSSQLNAVSEDRDDLGRNLMLPSLGMVYRMMIAKSDGLYVPGLKKALPILQRFLVSVQGGKTIFIAPQLQLKWGDYFEPSDLDESTRSKTAIDAYNANLVTLKSAVEHLKDVFAIGSVDQYIDALAKEKADRQQEQQDLNASMTALKASMAAPGSQPSGKPPPKAKATATK